ncbi:MULTISPECIES: ATP-binding protein [Leptolyngbya]|uniref:ATP-binding protein n=1 Tax=Leptolyngbya TaxID=47251 RepID=UPI001689A92D|nr:ATP-binding protein [Leptolyngbya sp. FACHB-1624]MBD1855520.1 putative DNA binding domain-containing protein [Leptolyngbya sp. FACHB-1624]
MTETELTTLLHRLLQLPQETEWVEFKHNDGNSEEIGEYLSALSNSAALHQQERAYLVWGVENSTHQVLGTSFKPRSNSSKVGNEDLECWLSRLLFPRLDFRIHEFQVDEKPVVIFEVPSATHTPVRFKETEFIRVGSYKKKIKEYPEKERNLWQRFQHHTFEKRIAMSGLQIEEVLSLIDYPEFFKMFGQIIPENRSAITERLIKEKVIVEQNGDYSITNLGAILYARDIQAFEGLSRKAVRVILYKGSDRSNGIKEFVSTKGYAIGFEALVTYVGDQLPRNEEIGRALRRNVQMYPSLAIRELVANALIHQDFTITGTSSTIEIFSDRIEITNPGIPLIDTLRFIDEPPISRNETLASVMRRLNICEERGSGIDKVIFQVEIYQLPPPDFQVTSNHTKAILYAPQSLTGMDRTDRIRACYQHACLCWVSNKKMTNTSLRERFGISDKNYPVASKIISETLKANRIKPYDSGNTSRKHASYIPFWA